MSWETAEVQRIINLEEALLSVQRAVNKLLSKKQFQQLLVIKQQQIEYLSQKVSELEADIANLESKAL